MLLFLQSNLSLVAGCVLVLLLLFARAIATEASLKRDLRGAVFLLLGSIALRLFESGVGARLTDEGHRVVEVAWMLAMAFGCIRTLVAFALWLLRLRQTQTPKILRDVIDFTLYTIAAIPILKSEFHFDVSSVVATSAAVSLVLGMALQETLGNFFAGMSIQLERPFQVGDYVQIQNEEGLVTQVTWRSTRIETTRKDILIFPNSILAKEPVRNFTRTDRPVASEIHLGLSYDAPPNRVKRVVLEVVSEIPHVLATPAPSVRTKGFHESSIDYRIRFYCEHGRFIGEAKDELLTRLWYRLRREGIEIPYPQTVVRHRDDEERADLNGTRRRELLRSVYLFSVMNDQQRDALAEDLVIRHFGRGERVIEAGAPGQTFYLVAEGAVAVMAGKPPKEVARLGQGQYFGEMSLLTGEPRSATVVAVEDALLLEFDRPTFARLFADYPDLARQLSALLAQRRSELRAVAQSSGNVAADVAPEANRIFSKLRQIFGLKD